MSTAANENLPKWGIREFADLFGVTPRTIRFYEDKGLLTPTRESGVRVFGTRDHIRFEKIMRGKRLGFSLEDIRAVFDVTDGVITDRSEILRRKRNFEAVIAGLQKRREDLSILAEDMAEVIAIAETAIAATPDDGAQVADLAARYQAAFGASTGNPIDFLSGSASTQTNKPN